MSPPAPIRKALRRGLEFGFLNGEPLIYDGVEPTCIDAQMGKGKFTRFIGVNLVSPRTIHLSKIITDPKDGELAWSAWGTLSGQGYAVKFVNAGDLYGYPSERYNPNTRVIEVARDPRLWKLLGEAAYDAASFLIPMDSDARTRWIGQGVRTMAATYNAITARFPQRRFPCNPGGLWDFFGRGPDAIAGDLLHWADQSALGEYAGICRQIATWTASPDQWNAYNSVIVERLQMFQPGSAAREVTSSNSFDPAMMKQERTALFLMGSARSEASRNFVGAMTAAVIERYAEAHGDIRALVVGEEWGQLYVSNFYEILTLYRSAGVNFLGVFQNAGAQIEAKYGKEVLRLWKKAVALTIYRGLPDDDTLKEIEYLSGKTSVMVRGFNASMSQVAGSGDNLVEQARPLLQVEDIRRLTGGEYGLLNARDMGFFSVEMPNFWERPEMSGLLRDIRGKPDRYAHLARRPMIAPPPAAPLLSSSSAAAAAAPAESQHDAEIEAILAKLKGGETIH